MKAVITKIKVTGIQELQSDIKEKHFVVAEEYHIDDKYTDGVDLFKIVTVKQGKSLGVDANTWQIADNTDINVVPMGLVYAGSINRHLAGDKEFKKRLPRNEEPLSMPMIDRMGLIIEGYDTSGARVYPTFELEDLRKPVYLGKNGDITMDKPSASEFNTPIGYVSSRNTIMLDLSNNVNKYNTPVRKN